jgi:RNA polymerase sigma factor (sigma-70 family)
MPRQMWIIFCNFMESHLSCIFIAVIKRTLKYIFPHTNKTDQELLEGYKKHHQPNDLGMLLQRYTLLLLGVCMKYLKQEEAAKDAVQQIFSKVITEVDKYPIAHFKSWLYTIAKNHCFMQLRNKNHVLPETYLETKTDYIAEEWPFEPIEQIKEKEKMLALMELCLEKLHPNQKECLSLFYLHHYSYQKICQITGFTTMQVKSFIQNGKRNMRIMIEKSLKENES